MYLMASELPPANKHKQPDFMPPIVSESVKSRYKKFSTRE